MITTAEEFVSLRTSEEPAEQQRATHDSAPLEVWLEIVRCYPEMRSWVAHNKTVPVEVLEILAKDEDAAVRTVVAMKRSCPPNLLEELAVDGDPTVRLRVAHNAKTPQAVLRRMLQDSWERVVEVATRRLASSSGDGTP